MLIGHYTELANQTLVSACSRAHLIVQVVWLPSGQQHAISFGLAVGFHGIWC